MRQFVVAVATTIISVGTILSTGEAADPLHDTSTSCSRGSAACRGCTTSGGCDS
jgi:hypothetical protein